MILENTLKVSYIKPLRLINATKNVRIRAYKLIRYVLLLIDVNGIKIRSFFTASFTVLASYFLMLAYCQTMIFLGGLSICH